MVGPTKTSFLFAPRRSEVQIRAEGPGIWQTDKREEIYGLTRVQPIEEFLATLQFFAVRTKKLYMLHGSQGNVQNEIELIRKSSQIGAEGVKEAIKGTRPGMYEYEIEVAARYVYAKLGARGDAFRPIVASGPNTTILHYSANYRRMMDGEIVYMDYGADYEYYTSDITRTWPVNGRFTPEQEKMYRCILEARDAIIAAMKPGVTIAQLKDVAEEAYKKHGFGKEFVVLGRYIGHPVGISVHDVEPPDRNRPLEAGVVYNVEPLLEFSEKKIHMRLEDTVLVTPTGAINMTAGVPASLDEIYALIRQKSLSINQ